jgi:glycosyltransferase involved in cell wall biosynthesis
MSDGGSLSQEFRRHTEHIISVPVRRSYREPESIRAIGRYVRDNRIDVINTFDLKGLLIARSIKSSVRGRIVIVHHAVNLLHNYRLRHKALLFFLLRSVDKVVCNSGEARHMLRKYVGGARMETIHNGIDTLRFRKNALDGDCRRELGVGDGEILLGTVANFRPEKNYPLLLDTFCLLLRSHPKAKLLCVGGGPLLDEIRRRAIEQVPRDRVIFPGYVDDVRPYLAAMNVFVLCSLRESLPNALIQAMSMEVPVVSTCVGGCSEIVDHLTNGVLFEPTETGALGKWLSKLLEDKEFAAALARKGRVKVEQAFSLEAMIDRYSDFYRKLVNGNAGTPMAARLLSL